jgi:hypothetical protein
MSYILRIQNRIRTNRSAIMITKSCKKEKYYQISQILITPEPLDLRAGITVNDITFFVLKIPGNDNEDIPFTDPDFLFDLSLDSPHPGHAIETTDPDMVCTHHQFSIPEYFPVAFLGELNPDDLITRR